MRTSISESYCTVLHYNLMIPYAKSFHQVDECIGGYVSAENLVSKKRLVSGICAHAQSILQSQVCCKWCQSLP